MAGMGYPPNGYSRMPESEPRSHGGIENNAAKGLPIPCGYVVDKWHPSDAAVVGFSVDRVALIVRNPHGTVREEANVDERWKTEGICSLSYFLLPVEVVCAIHNPPVLTGTTIDLEFSRR